MKAHEKRSHTIYFFMRATYIPGQVWKISKWSTHKKCVTIVAHHTCLFHHLGLFTPLFLVTEIINPRTIYTHDYCTTTITHSFLAFFLFSISLFIMLMSNDSFDGAVLKDDAIVRGDVTVPVSSPNTWFVRQWIIYSMNSLQDRAFPLRCVLCIICELDWTMERIWMNIGTQFLLHLISGW